MDFAAEFNKCYVDVIKTKYAKFDGRASRKEFWMFVLFNFVISFVLGFVLSFLHLGFLSTIYSIAVLVPSIAVGIRRLHDINKSGWWALLWFAFCIGWIALIVLHIMPGDEGENQYGPNPNSAA